MAETARKIIDLDLLTRYDGKIKNKIDTADQNLQNQINAINTAASNYATKTDLNSYATKTSLDSYALKTDLDSYASKQSVTDLSADIVALENKMVFASTDDIDALFV